MSARGRRAGGVALVALSGACFGAIGVFGRTAYAHGVDVPTLLFLRFSLAGVLLWAVVLARREPRPRGRALALVVALGAVGYASEAGAYFLALQHAPAGLVALLLYTFPALVALLNRWLYRERLGRQKGVALVLALGGSVLTLDPGGTRGGASALGIGLGLLSALIYAGYILASARALRAVRPVVASAYIMASAGAVFGGVLLARGHAAWPQAAVGWGAVAGLALVCSVVAVLALLEGLARVGPVSASLLSTVEPLVAVGLGALLLGEHLSAVQLVGGALIVAAVVVLARAEGTLEQASV